ncbi:hypothetical protein [Corynebacterium variabile]|uniref:hypothetical protein n=1 Tax=Corynebacterium variabile TaxID=1727 RepID=UPI0028AD5B26|nr:hypothetical protein [Corynebacterium variabile]
MTARKKQNGWDLALNNGDVLFVPVLDDAVTRVRTHLNLHQPTIDHHRVTVTLTVEPDPSPTPEPVAEPTVASSRHSETFHTPRPEPTPDPEPAWVPDPQPVWAPRAESPPENTPSPPPDPTPAPTPEMAEDIDGMSLTLRFLAARGASTDFAGAASQVLHWVDDLPELDRRQCLSDLWVALKVANEDFRYGPLEDAVSRWRPGAVPAPTTAPEPTYTAPDPEPIDLLPRVSPPPEAPPMSSPGYLSGFPEHSYAPPKRPTWAARPSRPARATQQHESGRHRL